MTTIGRLRYLVSRERLSAPELRELQRHVRESLPPPQTRSEVPGPGKGRLTFTPHAIERFIERCADGLTFPAALRWLQERAIGACRIGGGGDAGERWRIDDPPCVLVCKREMGKLVCVTVLTVKESETGNEDA